ncbi:MAG: 1-acyl-sn-glycerol-3-phosphate acyltransferase [Pelagimonas sp.]|jgi:1-acyl-sn-glycerol-3-phosphate acyltransferase|nr:1-acyl-sn-glycerol-3-phosphate acyltransferase [Pelagimonas sp.]
MQYVRSLIFNTQMYVMMLVIGITFFPWALISAKGARAACKTYCRWVCWTAGWMVGLKTEVRGEVPKGEVLVAAKHQSFLDILMIFGVLDAGKFIMKRELMYAPILGQYGLRIGCIPVNRGKRGAAIKKMKEGVANGTAHPGQLIIYAQGTRTPLDSDAPYKVGTAVLYEQMGQPCAPVAINCGVFWPKRGVLRKPGTAVVEFLPVIEPGLKKDVFLKTLAHEVETASDALMLEAGFDAKAARERSK